MWYYLSRNSKEIISTILFIYYVGALGPLFVFLSFFFVLIFFLASKFIHWLLVFTRSSKAILTQTKKR